MNMLGMPHVGSDTDGFSCERNVERVAELDRLNSGGPPGGGPTRGKAPELSTDQVFDRDPKYCGCEERDVVTHLAGLPSCDTCEKPIEPGTVELERLSTGEDMPSMLMAWATSAVAGLVLAKDIERLGALADMIGAVGRQLGEELAEAEPE